MKSLIIKSLDLFFAFLFYLILKSGIFSEITVLRTALLIGFIISVTVFAFRLLIWVYNKIFFKVRNRILGILLFMGLIPTVFLIIVFMIIGYLFLFQAISLDLSNTMEKEINKLKVLSLKINSHYLTESKIDKDGLTEFIQANSEDFPGIHFVVYNNDKTEEYVYNENLFPYFQHEGEAYQSFIVHDETPYIIVSLRKNSIINNDSIIAVPLRDDYIDHLSQMLEGSIFFSYLVVLEETEEVGALNINLKGLGMPESNDTIEHGFWHFSIPEEMHLSLMTSQKKEYDNWLANLPADFGYSKSYLLKDTVHLSNENEEIKRAVIIAIFHTNYLNVINNYMKGTIGIIEPFLILCALIVFLFLCCSLFMLMIGLFFTFSITRIINQLHKRSREIAKGHFPVPIASRRRDQLGELTRTFDKMTTEIQELLIKVKEKERLDNEVSIAQLVQRTFFPKIPPTVKNIQTFGKCIPAKMVSGDFYDFSLQDDYLDFCVGDISGKGISASLLMATSLTYLRLESFKRPIQSISSLINNFNAYLCEYSAKSQFCSLIYGRIDRKSSIFEFVNAGHPPPMIIRDNEVLSLESGNIVAGIIKNQDFEKQSFQLKENDIIFAFTDGFLEVMTENGYTMIDGLIKDKLMTLWDADLEQIFDALVGFIRKMSRDSELSDDMTAVLIRLDQ